MCDVASFLLLGVCSIHETIEKTPYKQIVARIAGKCPTKIAKIGLLSKKFQK